MLSIAQWVAVEKMKADSSWKHADKGQETTNEVQQAKF